MPHLALPYAVYAALALEMHLKTVLLIQSGTYPESHDLEELFRNLHKHTKARLAKRHKEIEKTSPVAIAMRESGLKTDIYTLLREGKDAFVLLRYAFEGAPDGTGFSLGMLTQCLCEMILASKPEWAFNPGS